MGVERGRSRVAVVIAMLSLVAGGMQLGACASGTGEEPAAADGTAATSATGSAVAGAAGDTGMGEPPTPVAATSVTREGGDADSSASPIGPGAIATDLVTDEALVGTYVAELLAAGSPGRRLQLDLAADGVAQMTSGTMNDEPPVVEIGSWQSYDDGSLTVVLTTRIGGDVEAQPTTLVLEVDGDNLVATGYDEAAFGSEGLTFVRQFPQ